MMQSKELRLGNLVYRRSGSTTMDEVVIPDTVKSIALNTIGFSTKELSINSHVMYLLPINISTEIISTNCPQLRPIETDKGIIYSLHKYGRVAIDGCGYVYGKQGWPEDKYVNLYRIQYLHQLQNLWYDINGYDMTINLPTNA